MKTHRCVRRYFPVPWLNIRSTKECLPSCLFKHLFCCITNDCFSTYSKLVPSDYTRLRWSRGSVPAFGTQVRGFKPGRSRWIFQGENILSTPSFGGEVKPFVPCRRFTACKRSLNVTWKSGIFRQNSPAISRPCSSTFGC